MNSLIMSTELAQVNENLRRLGFRIIESENMKTLLPFERRHADMQCLRINDTFFVLKECKTLIETIQKMGYNVIETEKDISVKYPGNVLLNAVYLQNKLYCNTKALDNSVKKYCIKNEIEIINVNQGYTKCSTAIIRDSFITSDRAIFDTISQNGVEGLLIESGCIELKGVNYGFIGGCCFSYNENVYFTGDIDNHPNCKGIKQFCDSKNINIVCLTENNLYDIGGFIVI
ncbi:MAG: hypothetical protein J1E96_00720 [Ruminococcus sp.]|nr:hypothetical protein [Ruminococcus sp.]